MDILAFESIRVIKGEKGRVIFKLRLPKLKEEYGEFNSFYSTLVGAYVEAAEKVAEAVTGDLRFTVSFTVCEGDFKVRKRKNSRKENSEREARAFITVRRSAGLTGGGVEHSFSATDVFDLRSGFFIK